MAVDYKFKKGTHLPSWHWLTPFLGGASNPGGGNAYDGVRYMYWAIQFGSTTAASSSQLWRFDTWTNGWQFLAGLTSGFSGMDVEYDAVRNMVYVTTGNTLNSWQVFNCNPVAVTVANQSIPAFSLATVTIVLPATATTGSSLTMPDDTQCNGIPLDTGTVAAGATATSITDNSKAIGTFGPGLVGSQVRFTSGVLNNQRRLISAVPGPTTVTTNAFTGAPGIGDTYVIEVPEDTASAGAVGTLTLPATWTAIVNFYANSDVMIVSGTGAGQRRRIASNTATVLTLAAAVTGNPRTGNFTTAPDATSVFRIVPSSDFLYFQPGGGTGLYRMDMVQTTGAAWSALLAAAPAASGGGANTMYAGQYDPFSILMVRGAGTANVYRYGLGPNSWTTLTTFWGSETLTTGGSACMIHGKRRIFIQKDSSTRCYTIDLTTGLLEPAGVMPYSNPSAYDGRRARYVKSPDGVMWIYVLRAGGQEFYRCPLEWIP